VEGGGSRRRTVRVSFGGEEERSWEEDEEEEWGRESRVLVGDGRLEESEEGGGAATDGKQSWGAALEQLREVGVGVGPNGWGGYTPALTATTGVSAYTAADASDVAEGGRESPETRLPPLTCITGGRGAVGRMALASGNSSLNTPAPHHLQEGVEWPFVDREEAMAGLSASGRLELPKMLRGPKTPVIFGFT
jgi:hypothetical protein